MPGRVVERADFGCAVSQRPAGQGVRLHEIGMRCSDHVLSTAYRPRFDGACMAVARRMIRSILVSATPRPSIHPARADWLGRPEPEAYFAEATRR
jgi:hypothetical protein